MDCEDSHVHKYCGWMLALLLIVLSASVAAQRGGGGGRGAERPIARTTYESSDYGFTFSVPSDMDLYTPDQPGAYRRIFTERRIVYVVSPMRPEESISIKYSDNVTEADLKSYQTTIETNPPQAKLPGFVKIGVANVPIGKDGAKNAVNFVYDMTTPGSAKAPSVEMTLRQVVFIHKGRGFTITFEAAKKRFDKVNKDTFDKFLSKIEFQ
jgi:hypothetical protein